MVASITFYPNDSKKSAKTKKIPMYVRACLNKRKAEMRLNIEVAEIERCKWCEGTRRFYGNPYSNTLLNKIETKFEEFRQANFDKLHLLSPKEILESILSPGKKSITLLEYIENYMQRTVNPNSQLTDGTKVNYRKAITHLERFLNNNKLQSIRLSDLNFSLCKQFYDYLLQSDPYSGKYGMKETSAGGNMKKFRTIFNVAVKEKLLPSNPFNELKLKHRSGFRSRLAPEQVQTLFNLDLRRHPRHQVYLDVFLMITFTGLSYNDIMSLEMKNLYYGKDGVKLAICRRKTGEPVEMYLTKYALEIVDKYKSHPDRLVCNYVLPRRSNAKLNSNLKIIGEMASIPFDLSSHHGRHTFRQLIGAAGITDTGVIKLLMGHSRFTDIDGDYYLASDSSLIEAKRKFEVYLDRLLLNGGLDTL